VHLWADRFAGQAAHHREPATGRARLGSAARRESPAQTAGICRRRLGSATWELTRLRAQADSAARQNAAMPEANDRAAALLDEGADVTRMTGGDPCRARVYTRAARAVAAHPQDVSGLPAAALRQIPGVGKSIAAKLEEIAASGSFAELEELRADIPAGV